MSGPKIVILVLVAVAIIFAVTVGVGSWPGGDPKLDPSSPDFDPNDAWFFRVLKRRFPSKSLDHARIESDCFKDGVFMIPEDRPKCEVDIRKGKASICDLKLTLFTGQATLTYEPNDPNNEDEHALPIKDRALDPNDPNDLNKPNKPFTLQIFKNGGTLTLTKVGPLSQTCEIRIEK